MLLQLTDQQTDPYSFLFITPGGVDKELVEEIVEYVRDVMCLMRKGNKIPTWKFCYNEENKRVL